MYHFALQTSKICRSRSQDLHAKIYLDLELDSRNFERMCYMSSVTCPLSHVMCHIPIFTESVPLGRFSHRVAMSVCGSVDLCVVLRHRVQFFDRPGVAGAVLQIASLLTD